MKHAAPAAARQMAVRAAFKGCRMASPFKALKKNWIQRACECEAEMPEPLGLNRDLRFDHPDGHAYTPGALPDEPNSSLTRHLLSGGRRKKRDPSWHPGANLQLCLSPY